MLRIASHLSPAQGIAVRATTVGIRATTVGVRVAARATTVRTLSTNKNELWEELLKEDGKGIAVLASGCAGGLVWSMMPLAEFGVYGAPLTVPCGVVGFWVGGMMGDIFHDLRPFSYLTLISAIGYAIYDSDEKIDLETPYDAD